MYEFLLVLSFFYPTSLAISRTVRESFAPPHSAPSLSPLPLFLSRASGCPLLRYLLLISLVLFISLVHTSTNEREGDGEGKTEGPRRATRRKGYRFFPYRFDVRFGPCVVATGHKAVRFNFHAGSRDRQISMTTLFRGAYAY